VVSVARVAIVAEAHAFSCGVGLEPVHMLLVVKEALSVAEFLVAEPTGVNLA